MLFKLLPLMMLLTCRGFHNSARAFTRRGTKNLRHTLRSGLPIDMDGATTPSTTAAGTTRVKRKMALVVGYVGSDYYGLQMDPKSTLATIERELERSLKSIGTILPTNSLSKIGFSRSSRTDKGVHAARIVLSGKLEVDESALVGRELRAPTLVSELNAELPADIRCFSVCKINQGFRARESCHFREYEFLLPLKLLTGPSSFASVDSPKWCELPSTAEAAMDSLNAVFAKMVGTRSFHNFHKLSPKNLRPKGYNNKEEQEEEEEEEEEEEDEEEVVVAAAVQEERVESADVVGSTDGAARFVSSNFAPWVMRHRDMAPKTKCTIYSFRAEGVSTVNGVEMVVCRVRGQAFLLHQIRLMIGSAILVARGILPKMAIDLAFLAPHHINFPMAPAEGLVLVNSGFARNANGMTVSLSGVVGSDADYVLMERLEFENSENWKKENIYSRVARDFSGDSEVISSFLEYAERFRCPAYTENVWREMFDVMIKRDVAESQIRSAREAARITKEILYFRRDLLLQDDRFAEFAHLTCTNESDTSALKRTPQKLQHKKLLPNALATALAMKFSVLPSTCEVTDCLRALATEMVVSPQENEDDLNPEMTCDEICEFVDRKGGLVVMGTKLKHTSIE